MPPKTNTVDGIARADSVPPKPEVPNPSTNPVNAAKPIEQHPKAAPKSNVRSAKKDNQMATIVITLIVMVLLIALAYFAYHKSR